LDLDELRACGMSRDAIHVRVRSGRLHPIHARVWAVGHKHLTLEARFLAAVKACRPNAWLSHFSAAALWGFVDWTERDPEVTVVDTTTRVLPGIRVHRTQALGPEDVRMLDGIPVTSPARTLVDIAASMPYKHLRHAARRAQGNRRMTVGQLRQTHARLAPRRGSRNLARILATGPAPTRSELEDAVLDLMLEGGLIPPDVNVPLVLGGRCVIPDFRWPKQKLVVEADGAAWHDNQIAREDDAERQALLEAYGERVIRVTWGQVIAEPRQTLARIIAAGAPRSTRVSTVSA
jgi:hypothetical protein